MIVEIISIHFSNTIMKNFASARLFSYVGMMNTQMLREKLILIEHFITNRTRKCFRDDAMHRPSMPFQIGLICICAIAILRCTFIRLFSCMNLVQSKEIGQSLDIPSAFWDYVKNFNRWCNKKVELSCLYLTRIWACLNVFRPNVFPQVSHLYGL